MKMGWIGVDFDGTLVKYNGGDFPDIGEPLYPMIHRIKDWLVQGYTVKIVTARVSHNGELSGLYGKRQAEIQREVLQKWCIQYIGRELEITCSKDYDMLELWDDRAVQVEANTGKLIGISTRGL